ncbi:MAG: hypothetical protein EOO23_04590 [Comamonadaceae bacterium]|nr:MAG: hypothetical protein EOO23_04590 [Comamonadaceae bacterium]
MTTATHTPAPADIIRTWCASCGMPAPSNGDCMALEVALTRWVDRQMDFKQIEALMHKLHAEHVNSPEYLWLDVSFEDMADKVNKARFCASEPRDEAPDNSWMGRQDIQTRNWPVPMRRAA